MKEPKYRKLNPHHHSKPSKRFAKVAARIELPAKMSKMLARLNLHRLNKCSAAAVAAPQIIANISDPITRSSSCALGAARRNATA